MNKRNPFAGAATPPQTVKKPVDITQHGRTRSDNYVWLRDDNWQEVLRDPSVLDADIRSALEAENAYYETLTGELEGLRKKLFSEMRGRIKEDDATVPARDGDWKYWIKYREGGEYPIFMRAPIADGEEQVLFDGDKEGAGAKFFDIGAVSHSPDHCLASVAVDCLGSEYYTIRVHNIETGVALSEVIENADGGGAVWTADADGFYYVERDDKQRPKRVKLHLLRTDPVSDAVVYEEPDDGFFLDISKSQSGAYIFIRSASHTTSEVRFIPADDSAAAPILIEPRQQNVEYKVEHHGDEFYILTNADGAVDFKIIRTPVVAPGKDSWVDWIAHRAGVYISTFVPYNDYIVRLERVDALPRIIISTYDGVEQDIKFDGAAYNLGLSRGFQFETDILRFAYDSPSTPRQVFDYDMRAHARTLLKTQQVPSGHDPSLYVVERVDARARDGADIPVMVLRLKSTPKDGAAPVLLYGYGAYGMTIPDSFSTNILPLVDRGVIYALAHVRGGAEKGRQWYLDGKRDKKMNSFTDFIASAEALIAGGFTSSKNIVIYGGSAGGLLVGASVNLRPDLFAGAIGAVPFVDVLTTISDADLPLTPPEWDEWGNPITSKEQYDWIAAYSPYDNIQAADYPPIMATAGLADYRVTYWEPAKWVARLRDEARGGPFVLRTNMGAGHGGSAARFEQLEERAHLYAFALKVLGMESAAPVVHEK
jgi:oligopeptidase B